jgi:hypothetical protein
MVLGPDIAQFVALSQRMTDYISLRSLEDTFVAVSPVVLDTAEHKHKFNGEKKEANFILSSFIHQQYRNYFL